MRPVPKRAFAFRYIESLGQNLMVADKTNRPSERRIIEACHMTNLVKIDTFKPPTGKEKQLNDQ